MKRLIAVLMRHGEFHQPSGMPSAHLPHPLTFPGQQQARDGALELLALVRQNRWELDPVIDCSSLLRAWQTATIAAEALCEGTGVTYKVEQFDELSERSLGAAANLTVDEIEEIVRGDPRFRPPPKGWKSDSAFRLPFPGCESMIDAGGRVSRHIAARARTFSAPSRPATAKLFVGHGGSFRHAVAEFGALTLAEAAGRSMYHARPVCFELNADGGCRHIAGAWKMRRSSVPSAGKAKELSSS